MRLPEDQYLDFQGRKICFAKVSYKTDALWFAWATKKLPCPLELYAKVANIIPLEVSKELGRHAQRKAERGWSREDKEIQKLQLDPDGQFASVRVLIQVGQGCSEEEACELLSAITHSISPKKLGEILDGCRGAMPAFLSQTPPTVQANPSASSDGLNNSSKPCFENGECCPNK